MPTYPLATLAAEVTSTGIAAPQYNDILESLKASFRIIYGDDAYLEPDSQDGQLLAVFAQAVHDANQTAIAVYNSFSPQTAVGAALSNNVKINHMQRLSATKSQVNVVIVGVAGTTISNGVVSDAAGSRWTLPASVTIPPAGTITVTATAEEDGATTAPANSVTLISTPTAGWQTVNNPDPATPGQPVESDAELRARQEITPALNSSSVLAALAAALNALPGVAYGRVYENDLSTADANGIPARHIACVVKGGVAADIAATIYAKKTPGVGTHGTTTVVVEDVAGVDRDIKFFVPTERSVAVKLYLYALSGYNTDIANRVRQAVVDAINALEIGEDVIVTRLWGPALLCGDPESLTYKLTDVFAAFMPTVPTVNADLVLAFNEKATAIFADVTIEVL